MIRRGKLMDHSPGNRKNDGWETLQRQARSTEDDRGSDTITTERGKVLKATKEKKDVWREIIAKLLQRMASQS